MDAPVPMLTSDETNFTNRGPQRQFAVASHHDFQHVGRALLPDQPQSPMQNQPRRQPAQGRSQHALPDRHHLRDFNGIARPPQEEMLHGLDARSKKTRFTSPPSTPTPPASSEVKRLLA